MVAVSERQRVDDARAVRDDLALDSAEQYIDVVFDSAPVMLHSIDKDGRIVKINRRWLAELGYKESEVVGRRSTDFLTDESRARALRDAIPHFWRTGSAHSVGYQFVKNNGEVLELLLDAELVHDAVNRPMGIAALYSCDDLVEWRQASATIKAIQSLAGVLQCDIDGSSSPPDPEPNLESLLAGPSRELQVSVAPISGDRFAPLTERELEVLALIAIGARNKEIAGKLSITGHTVKFHIENLHKKLGVRTRAEAVRVATERGLLKM